jgi:hypothetical protein
MNYITPEAAESSLMPYLPAFTGEQADTDELTCQVCLQTTLRIAATHPRCNFCLRLLPENMYYYYTERGNMYCTRKKCKPKGPIFSKKLVLPRIEDELVACMFCKKKTHIVCGIINTTRDPNSDYICRACLVKWHANNKVFRVNTRFVPAFARNIADAITVPGVVVKEVMANFDHQFVHAVSNRPIKYGERCFMVFFNVEGADVLIFIMFAQYYFESNHLYISYLDSVNYFTPKEQRTKMYHSVILGLINDARLKGYTHVFIWSCPPLMGDDYIFNLHPLDQKMPDQNMLNNWYIRLINEGIVQGIMSRWEPLVSFMEPLDPMNWPWFHGDYNTIVYNPDNKQDLIACVRERGESLLVCHLIPVDNPVQDARLTIKCDFVKSRCDFLENCMGQSIQFKDLRLAIHASYMILHFILNPEVSFTVVVCDECDGKIKIKNKHKQQLIKNSNYSIKEQVPLYATRLQLRDV